MNRETAVHAVGLLREAEDKLNEYRAYVTENDGWRGAIWDVMFLDVLDTAFNPGDDYVLLDSPDEVMVSVLMANEGAHMDGGEFFDEDVIQIVTRLELVEEAVTE